MFTKRYQNKVGNTFYASSCYSLVVSLACLLIALIVNGFKVEFELYSFIISTAYALILVSTSVFSVKTLSLGKVSIYTLFLMLGGMIVPFVYGALFLGEEVRIIHVIATAILVIALILPTINFDKSQKSEKPTKAFILMCLLIFMLNGVGSTLAKIHQVYEGAKLDTNSFTVLFSLVCLVFSIITFLIALPKNDPKLLLNKETLIASVGYSVVHMVGLIIQLFAALRVTSGLLFPLCSGGTLIFTPLLSLICYKEKIDKTSMVCILMSVVATVLFAF